MDYKILEVHVFFLHDQDEYTLHVAIQSAEGYWRAFKKRQLRFDYAAAQSPPDQAPSSANQKPKSFSPFWSKKGYNMKHSQARQPANK